MTVIAFSGTIGPVPLDIFIREKHSSDLTITKVPIERGADVTDHAFRQPDKLSIEIAASAAAETFAALKRFQRSRLPFTIVSGLDVYSSMLIEHLEADRDSEHGNILFGKVDLSEIIIADSAGEEGGTGSSRPGQANSRRAQPGGRKSTRTATPTKSRASGAVSKARATSKVGRGDISTKSVTSPSKRSSILKSLTG